jgi:predicted DNA-binding transcriptional regulator AlpA
MSDITTTTPTAATPADAALLDVKAVAALCGCSTRHIRRLADEGKLEPPLRLGALCKWRRASIEAWIAAGCPSWKWAKR